MHGISIREFARQEGVSDTLVRRALKQKRLMAFSDGSLDPTLVGSVWCAKNAKAANSSHSVRGSRLPANDLGYSEALRVKENYLALLRKLEYEEKSGSLIDVASVERVVFEMFRSARDAWLGWPTKIAPHVAQALGIDEIDRVATVLGEHVHAQLHELGEPQADFGPSH